MGQKMKLKSLYNVEAKVLPPRVMVLLSKFAKAIKNADGVTIKLSSLNVFKHIHNSYVISTSAEVEYCYIELAKEVNEHLENGSMECHASKSRKKQDKSTNEREHRFRSNNRHSDARRI